MKKFLSVLIIFGFALGVKAQSNLVPDNIEFQALKNMFDSLGGSAWSTATGWPVTGNWPASATSAQFGTWAGVTVQNGDVIGLTLAGYNLTGQVPVSIGFFTQLTSLNLSYNSIGGHLPSSLNKLTYLNSLYLSSNQFTGDFPYLGSLVNLTAISAYNLSQLSGPFPSWLGNLRSLTFLQLEASGRYGPIPSNFQNLTQLWGCDLRYNNLSGTIPAYFGNFYLMQYLYFGENQFTGTIPASFGNMINLHEVNFEFNQLSGQVPAGLFSISSLGSLDLQYNEFTSLPSNVVQFGAAKTLYLAGNHFDFSQLEPLVSAGYNESIMIPQKAIANQPSVLYFQGHSLTITPSLTITAHTTVSWQKKQSNGTWSDATATNNDATQKTYLRNNPTSSDVGTYRWSMTNTVVTGTTIQGGSTDVDQGVVTVLNNFAFQYQYDYRRRIKQKKVPGADWVYMVYDSLDRLVLTQDGNQRLDSQWMFVKYDVMNRLVSTGIYSPGHTFSQAKMQATVNSYYANLSSAQAWYESFSTATGNIHNYDNKSFPQITDPNQYFSVTYYDDAVRIQSLWGTNYSYVNDNLANGSYIQWATPSAQTVGHPVGSKLKLLDGSNTWLKIISYYDDRYRVIQTIGDNIKAGSDRTSNLYDFVGRLLAAKATHITSTHANQTIVKTFDYDHVGRSARTWHSINGSTPIILAAHQYNEIGQLITKQLYSTAIGKTFQQNIDQRYNIRGWITNINNSSLGVGVTNSDTNDLFGMDFFYDLVDPGLVNNGQYNGNISGQKWSSNIALGTTKSLGYSFRYDTLNRIQSATYFTNPGTWASTTKFAENGIKYDFNGNIKKLTRTDPTGLSMDILSYDYTGQSTTGNQLHSVTDAGDINNGFLDGNIIGDDYAYDANGNMTMDKNKSIDSITYNYLNLPQKVKKHTGENIHYLYDATGRKLRQQVYNSSNVLQTTTQYDGDFIYQFYGTPDTLKFINHEEGRAVMNLPPGTQNNVIPEYQYHLKDHLGNVRATFTTLKLVDQPIATFEPANAANEEGNFLRFNDARLVNSTLFDHTHVVTKVGTTGYAERLSGPPNEMTGIEKSISVMPGDTIKLEVYAKYVDASNSNNSAAMLGLIANIVAGTTAPGTVIDGTNYLGNGAVAFPFAGLAGEGSSTGTGPKAYLNYLIYDRNFVKIDGGYVRMNAAAAEDGTNKLHEKLSAQFVITQPGYVYTYLSNEETSLVETYWDDFKVTQVKSPIVQQSDYYPFGLTFNSYQRENSVVNKYLYNAGSEIQLDLNLNVYETEYRMLDPTYGRWWQIDPKVDNFYEWSPYNYAYNNPSTKNDPKGDCLPLCLPALPWVLEGAAAVVEGLVAAGVGTAIIATAETFRDEIVEAAANSSPYTTPGVIFAQSAGGTGSVHSESKSQEQSKARGSNNTKTKESAKTGQEAHRQEQEKLKAEGAETEVPMTLKDGTNVRKDAVKPDGTAVIIKPNTPSGQKSAAKREELMKKNEKKTETLLYDPTDAKYQPGSPTYLGPKNN